MSYSSDLILLSGNQWDYKRSWLSSGKLIPRNWKHGRGDSERSGLGLYFVIIFSSLRFIIVSNWESEAALERHLKTTHVRDFAKLIADKGSIEHFRRYKKIIWWDLYKNLPWNKCTLIPIFTFLAQKTWFFFEAHLKVINVFKCKCKCSDQNDF